VLYTGIAMTKYKAYYIDVDAGSNDGQVVRDVIHRGVQALSDFYPLDGKLNVTDRLARAREVARAIETVFPFVQAKVENFDTRDLKVHGAVNSDL